MQLEREPNGDHEPQPAATADAEPQRPLRIGTVLRLAVAFGLFTGLVDAIWLTIAKVLRSKYLTISPQFVWMAPVADVFLFSAAAVVLLMAARLNRRLASPAVPLALFTFLSYASVLFLVGGLHGAARILLAAGLAVQTTRLILPRRRTFESAAIRAGRWMTAATSLVALYAIVAPAIAERRAIAALPPAPAAGRPNIVLLILDTVRAANLGLYGYRYPTAPVLDRLARSAIVFERAIAPAPWTMPSHASMFTAKDPHALTADWQTPLDDRFPTIAEVLKAHGYVTAGFVANSYYAGSPSGLGRGFVHFEDYAMSFGEMLNSASLGELILAGRVHSTNTLRRLVGNNQMLGRKSAEEVRQAFARWVASRPADRPFFAFLNFFDAHSPYYPPQPFASSFLRRDLQGDPTPMSAYDGVVAYLDYQIGLLLDDLAAAGLDKNTAIIITADHGELFGEHGLYHHGNSLYLELLNVPLIISDPAHASGGRRVATPVTLKDLPATMLDIAGVSGPPMLEGRSLSRFWNPLVSEPSDQSVAVLSEVRAGIRSPRTEPVAKGDMLSLIGFGMHYIRNGDHSEELFDLGADPAEQFNLATRPAHREMIQRFRGLGPVRQWGPRQ